MSAEARSGSKAAGLACASRDVQLDVPAWGQQRRPAPARGGSRNPAAFEPDLARGLWTFAWVRVTGHLELPQALTAAEESTTRYEGLVRQLPQAFTEDLSGALATLADVLNGLDRSEEAAGVRRRIGG